MDNCRTFHMHIIFSVFLFSYLFLLSFFFFLEFCPLANEWRRCVNEMDVQEMAVDVAVEKKKCGQFSNKCREMEQILEFITGILFSNLYYVWMRQ